MHRRTFLATVGSSATLAIAGCLDGGAQASGDHDVGMSIDSFRPEELQVTAGTTVTWRNTSSHGHTVTAYQDAYPSAALFFASGGYETAESAREAWKSDNGGVLAAGETFEHTFEVPGRYDYFCIPHEDADMIGAVEVTGGE
jgi:plastocyanin